MWKALRGIARGTTLYYTQFNLFLILLFVATFVWAFSVFMTAPSALTVAPIASPTVSVNTAPTLPPAPITAQSYYKISINSAGVVTVNGKKVDNAIIYYPDKDEFLLVLARDTPVYMPAMQATVHVPRPIDNLDTLNPYVYAVHGVSATNRRLVDPQTIEFEADGVYEGATVSVRLDFPQGYFLLSPLDRFREQTAAFSPADWARIAVVFPVLTGLFLLLIVLRQMAAAWRVRTGEVSDKPPAYLPPAIIGALARGRIGKREITATLFDLALRGYIYINSDEKELAFRKGEGMYTAEATKLRPFEIFLLHQIFSEESASLSRQSSVEVGLNSELFSSKVALTMLNIYDATLAEGFFIQSPNRYYLKYKIIGWLLFFSGLLAMLYGALTIPSKGYVIFPWLGMIAASLLIIGITPGLPRRTPIGNTTLRQWLSFRNYLRDKAPLSEAIQDTHFFDYLPYALVLGCEKEWIARCQKHIIHAPSWYSSTQPLYTAEDYGASMVGIINYMATHLVAARPPDLA